MTELDEEWSKMISDALEKARDTGRDDVADYLSLRAVNDAIRLAGVKWLIGTLAEMAANELHNDRSASIERIDPYSFTYRGSNIVGTRLEIRRGVRQMTAEAGWTRTPADGFMRGGALAIGRIVHFGMPKEKVELALKRAGEGAEWGIIEDGKFVAGFGRNELAWQFSIFTG